MQKFLFMLPILAGIAVCNVGDLSFNLIGLSLAVLSNLFHIIKGVSSKFYFVDQKGLNGTGILFQSGSSVMDSQCSRSVVIPQANTSGHERGH